MLQLLNFVVKREIEMARNVSTINITGMNQDMSKLTYKPVYAFENKNIRITPRDESNTSLAITNEKGTKELFSIFGTPVGKFECDNYFGIFSFTSYFDYITVYEKKGDDISILVQWCGNHHDLGFNELTDDDGHQQYKIETVVSVEASNSIRVYWVDGVHQPRVVDFMKLAKLGSEVTSLFYSAANFDFLPQVKSIENFSVTKQIGGYFFSGTVQFVVTEVINGNESNIAYYSPLYYVSDDANNLGYAPDNSQNGLSFTISFNCKNDSDVDVDYLKVYAIYRSSKDSSALVMVQEVVYSDAIRLTMIGNEEADDSSRLMFLNRERMLGAKTITQKDGLMFIGNWKGEENVLELTEDKVSNVTSEVGSRTVNDAAFNTSVTVKDSQLKKNSFEIGHFKKDEGYMLGYQLMNKYGYWSTPIAIKNGSSWLHTMSKSAETKDGVVTLPEFASTINLSDEKYAEFVKVRPVVAYLDDTQKPCLYQGFLTPTIFCEKERVEGTCYAKLSPFTRAVSIKKEEDKSRQIAPFWANPDKILCPKGLTNLLAEVYVKYHSEFESFFFKKDFIWSRLAYQPTAFDKHIDEDDSSMLRGTYPVNQHWAELPTMKDYNCEMQTSIRYRDVRLKTALIQYNPNSWYNEEVDGLTVIYRVGVSISLIVGYQKAADLSILYSTEWIEYVYFGKGSDGQYLLMVNCKDAINITKNTYDVLNNVQDSNYNKYWNSILWGEAETDGSIPSDISSFTVFSEPYSPLINSTVNTRWGKHKFEFSDVTKSGTFSATASATNSYTSQAMNRDWYSTARARYDSECESNVKKVYGKNTAVKTINVTSGIDSLTNNDVCTLDNSKYFVDAQTVTLHSPDILDESVYNINQGKVKLVGSVRMNGFCSDTNIVAQTAKINMYSQGNFGFQSFKPSNEKSGRCAMNLPNWNSAFMTEEEVNFCYYWAVPPFGVSDYLAVENNDRMVTEKKQSELEYHQLSNYRFCDITKYQSFFYDSVLEGSVNICTSERIKNIGSKKKLYKPNEDTVVAFSLSYFWSNGPYYSTCTDANYPNWHHGGMGYNMLGENVRNINKFKNYNPGSIWQQLMYTGIWCTSDFISSVLRINMESMISLMASRDTDRGYWKNGGSAGIKLVAGDNNVNIQNQYEFEDKHEYYRDSNMNEYYANGGWTRTSLAMHAYTGDWGNSGYWDKDDDPRTNNINLKYKSTPHAVIDLNAPLWDYSSLVESNVSTSQIYSYVSEGWKKNNSLKLFTKDDVQGWRNDVFPDIDPNSDFLWLADIVNNENEPVADPYTAKWIIAGEAVDIENGKAPLRWVQGNWYFQRFDCLRTYPESIEDKNQVVEIVSFMCETRRNVDGRYDTNGGKAFLQANPTNYNKINPAYTQENNFFCYSIPKEIDNVVKDYPNTIAWSTPKVLNSNVDSWSSITGASVLDIDGDKGPITHLSKLANKLFCFQPSGISYIMYNERAQISTEQNTPIELAMSGKVEGKEYLSNSIGCGSNWKIIETGQAVYFWDGYNKMLCALTEGIKMLSEEKGMHSWAQNVDSSWMHLMFDRRNSSMMIVSPIVALVYGEKIDGFESFMDYEGTYDIINVQEKTLLIHKKNDSAGMESWSLYEMNGGEYNKFFGLYKDYWVDLFVGGSPTDKVFDNIEFRGDLLTDGDELATKACPFNTIRAYNEYQDSGERVLTFEQYSLSNLKNRFRTWDCYVPRNKSSKLGRIPERMRNPWCHILLKMKQDELQPEDRLAMIQDINVFFTE